MTDDPKLTQLTTRGKEAQVIFVLVEVKTAQCQMNGPWSEPQRRNMQRVIRRLGFAKERDVDSIAADMYRQARWENEQYALQYVCVGRQASPDLQAQYSKLVQIEWKEVADFLLRRFRDFPEKLPEGPIHEQWPDFGRKYATWFERSRSRANSRDSEQAVERYIHSGSYNL